MNIALRLRSARRANSLAAQHLIANVVPLAAAMACVLASQLASPGSLWAALWGLAAGACLGLLVAWSLARSLVSRIRFARAKAELVAGDVPAVPGDDLDQITARIDHIARQLRDRQDARTAAEEGARRAADARTEFLAAMNHELRTPLNAILGFGQVLDMSPSLQIDERESLKQVLRAGRHLLRLVNELLQISEAEGGQSDLSPEPVQVAELMIQTLDLVHPMAAHRHIEIDAAGAMAPDTWVTADRHRLQQVLLNLLTNAVKFNRDGGRIRVTTAPVTNGWRLSVGDTGMGFAEADRQRLFAPFDRLDAAQKGIEGTGLGLALAKGLAERMNGRIGVESSPGAGSTFWIDLPRAQPPSEGARQPRRSSGAADFVVVHIEDNPADLSLVERILERERVRVLPAMQGRLGVALAVEHHPALVLLDLNLPDTHGLDVLSSLRRDPRTADVPVIIITADITPGQQRRALTLGAIAVITKPLDVAGFVDLVSVHLSRDVEPCPPAK